MAPSIVLLLDHDPDLAEDLPPGERQEARRRAVARVARFPRGPWSTAPGEFDSAGSLGLLIIEGLLVRKVTVGRRTCAELLGPGDVAQPWLRIGPDWSVGAEVNWQVAEPVAAAVLDREFTARVARWPELTAAVARRVMWKVHWLSFHLAVSRMRRVDDRLLLVLWHFADRWGRGTPAGVELRVPLTHSLLALVVGAHRPSVTTALRNLAEEGRIEALPRSRWRLHGGPPDELRRMHEHAARREGPRSAGVAPA